ncbi:acyltransferase [Priestia megaterium]|uniref:acyltransferase family protein n=1 Tax=Priestia megaterium TaxID=1404 RepID=UPI002E1B7E30|nr:acyltransferase [Priestia megaterium]
MKKRYVELDSVRGLAALFVVINHYLMIFPSFSEYSYQIHSSFLLYVLKGSPLRLFFSSGNESVVLFFVLSGFVLALPFYESSSFRYGEYVIRRVCRIYLPYLFSVCLAIGCKVLFAQGGINELSLWFNNSWNIRESPRLLIEHFFLIGTYNTDAYNNVIWSLVHEMRISLLFPLILLVLVKLSSQKVMRLFFFIFALSSLLLLINQSSLTPTSYLLSFHYLLLFMAGAITAKYRDTLIHVYRARSWMQKIGIITIGFALYLSEGVLTNYDITNNFLCRNVLAMAGSCILIVLALASPAASKMLKKKLFTLLGEISYSLYLVHLIVLFSFIYLLHGRLPYEIILCLCFFASFCLAIGVNRFVEKPSCKFGKMLVKNKNIALKNNRRTISRY